jgi:hypothetical protein
MSNATVTKVQIKPGNAGDHFIGITSHYISGGAYA